MSKSLSDVHAKIADIARNYHYHQPIPWLTSLRDLAAAAYRRLIDWILAFLATLHIETDTSTIGSVIKSLLLILGLGCACLILLIAWRQFRYLSNKVALPQTNQLKIAKPSSSQAWFEEAMAHNKARCWKKACRALYMSCLRLFDERAILTFVATRTNFEVWYALSKYDNLAQIFRSLANTVDKLWFGTKAAQETDFLSCLDDFRAIRLAVDEITSSMPNSETVAQIVES